MIKIKVFCVVILILEYVTVYPYPIVLHSRACGA